MTFGATPGVERGCGHRVVSGIYGELGLGPGGRPVEDFLMDPPVPVDHLTSLSSIGVTLMERDGVTHVLDWIGEAHYPNVADFMEEVRRFGLSRRLPRSIDFSLLTPETRILCVHRRAWISNPEDYRPRVRERIRTDPASYFCPKKLREHVHGTKDVPCAGLWWEDITGGEEVPLVDETGDPRLVSRRMPSFEYQGLRAAEDVTPSYRPAIFASFPMSRIVVVVDPDNYSPDPFVTACCSSLTVEEVDS